MSIYPELESQRLTRVYLILSSKTKDCSKIYYNYKVQPHSTKPSVSESTHVR